MFCHLHVHDEFSFLDGFGDTKSYCKRALELDQTALSLTNHGSIDGLIKFQKECKKNDIIPILGCLLEGQLIITSEGVEAIENIAKKDLVLTHKGRFRPVIETMKRQYKGELYTINLAKNKGKISLTEEHPILIRDHSGSVKWATPDKISFGRWNKEGGINCWKNWACFPKVKSKNDKILINILNFLPKKEFVDNKGKIRKIRQLKYDRTIDWDIESILEIDEDLAYFLGLYIGEGSGTYNKKTGKIEETRLTFNINEEKMSFWVMDFLKKRFRIKTREYIDEIHHTREVAFSCRPIGEFLVKYCGRGSHNKKISADLFGCTSNIRKRLIQGLIDADGDDLFAPGNKNHCVNFGVASKNLAWQFKILIASEGHLGKVSTVLDKKNKTYSYSVSYSPCRKYARSLEDEDYIYFPISSITHEKVECNVYNIHVEEDNSYVSDFILHNCEAYIVKDATIKTKGDDRGHITLLVKNEKGFQNLCKMLTYGNLTGFYYRPRIDYDILYENCEGLIVLTGCSESFLMKEGGEEFFYDLKSRIPDDIYLEVMPHNFAKQKEINKLCIDYANKYDIPLVGTNDCHYVNEDDAETQEVLLAMQTKAKWTDKDRFKFTIKGLHLRSEIEMRQAFSQQKTLTANEIDEAINSTTEIVDKCKDFFIKKQPIFLPKVPGFEQISDEKEFLRRLALARLKEIPLYFAEQIYLNQLEEELKMIDSKGFIPYFMIIWDLVAWCKKNDIMVGPGRGSAAGSLLSYLLGITAVDPLKFNLLFSRFIAEDRQDFPDIDLDFPDYKRHLIREHLEALYGQNNISSISTFLTMKGRAVIRDVARVFDVPLAEVDEFAKFIDYRDENEENIVATAVKDTPQGKEFAKKYPNVVKHAIKLEGQIKNSGQHAAGVIISADNLLEGTKGNLVMRNNFIVSNWDMEDSEYVGLMKLDVLGLNTLSVLNEAKDLIKNNTQKTFAYHPESDCYLVVDKSQLTEKLMPVNFEFEKIPLDDIKIYQEIAAGNTVGVFQLSAWPTTKLAKEIQADNFTHLSDVIALVRPGPFYSGMTQEYIERKKGATWKKKHPIYEKITEKTFGVIIYQEQVMEVINKVAGLPYSTADKIRKIVAKKRDPKEFKPFKDSFVQGCLTQKTLSKDEAEEFWEGLKEHASYSFNLSHSISYAMLGYWTAYVKCYFPTEFICANLTYGSEGKKEEIIDEAYRLGLEIITPQVGISDAYKWVAKGNKLYCPFIEIKGIGEKTALNCVNFKRCEEEIRPQKRPIGALQPFFTTGKEKKLRAERKVVKSKLEELLQSIGAFGNERDPDINKYFSFKIQSPRKEILYPNLLRTLQFGFPDEDFQRWMELDIPTRYALKLIKQESFQGYKNQKKFEDCLKCSLGNECKFGPVPPSPGEYNIMIVGEAPGKNEDEKGMGFIGKAGESILWPELKKYGLTRELFHITNCVKCYPSESKTPNKEHITTCHCWLEEEIKQLKPCLILAFGNVGVECFTDRKGGVTDLSGKTEWNEKAQAWICWCLHPSAVLHNPNNRQYFELGIKNFSEKISLLGNVSV